MILSPLNVPLSTPSFVHLKWIEFTYLIPFLPLFILRDSVISIIRTYTVEELNTSILQRNAMIDLPGVGITKGKPVDVGYLLGIQRK